VHFSYLSETAACAVVVKGRKDNLMQKVERNPALAAENSNDLNTTQMVLAVIAVLVTFLVLYIGFVFLRDSATGSVGLFGQNIVLPSAPSPVLIAIIAILWGVGGIAALYFVFNWLVESFSLKWTQRLQPFVFVGPAIALLAWYLAVPTVRTLVLSFYDRTSENFVGLENYQAVFSERIMREALSNNMVWLVVGTALTVSLGLLIALLADRSGFERVSKALIFMPMAISMVGAGVIWRFVYDADPNLGLLNSIVVGLGGEPQDWLRNVQPWNNLFLIVVMVWLQTGYAMVLISAAIKGIPDELLEAARVDGANEVTVFFRIMLPSIAGTLLTVTTTVIIFTLKIFDVVMVMTGGQFGTEVIGVRFYREMFTNGNDGYASAIAIVLLIAVIPVMIYNLRDFSSRQTF
jgi:alpha-glucoside transport system permease protein